MPKNTPKIFLIIFTLYVTMVPGLAWAGGTPLDTLKTTVENSDFAKADETSAAETAGVIIASFLSVLGIIFMVMLTYGGLLWTSAGGNDEKVGKAKKILRNSIIGILITAGSYAIYAVISKFLIGT